MSALLLDESPLPSGTVVDGGALGLPGTAIPPGSALAPAATAHAGSALHIEVLSFPEGGALDMQDDGTYSYSGPAGTLAFEVFVDGVSQGPQSLPLAGSTTPVFGSVFSSTLRAVEVLADDARVLGKFTKQPADLLDYRFDCAQWLRDCSDEIAGYAVTASPVGLQVLQVLHKDSSVAAFVGGGENGKTYKLTCTITTVGGRTKEAEITVRVRES